MWNSESESLSIGLIYWVTLKFIAYWVMFTGYNEHPSARTWDCSFPDPYIIRIRLQIIKLWISKLKCQIYSRSSFISFDFKPIFSSIMSTSIFSKTANAVNSKLGLFFIETENKDDQIGRSISGSCMSRVDKVKWREFHVCRLHVWDGVTMTFDAWSAAILLSTTSRPASIFFEAWFLRWL